MFWLVVIYLVLFAILALTITAWSMWYQSQIYTETAQGLEWRGPAAAGGIVLALILFGVMAARSPGTFQPVWELSTTHTLPPLPEVWVPDEKGELHPYRPVRTDAGTRVYHRGGNSNSPRMVLLPKRNYLVIKEDGEEVKFEPQRDEKGNLLRRKTTVWGVTEVEEPVRYVDNKGRVMYEGSLGQFTVFRSDVFFSNLFLNLLLFAACFLGLWVLVLFQWTDALYQALVLWLVLVFFVVPPVMRTVEATTARPPEARSGD